MRCIDGGVPHVSAGLGPTVVHATAACRLHRRIRRSVRTARHSLQSESRPPKVGRPRCTRFRAKIVETAVTSFDLPSDCPKILDR